jgi:hypothetical protein
MSEDQKMQAEERATPDMNDTTFFTAAYLAALGGILSRTGVDPSNAVNEAFRVAERSVERFASGEPIMSEGQRETKKTSAAAAAAASSAPAVSGGGAVFQGGGPFRRPAASP